MRELIEFVAKSLVDKPDSVEVTEEVEGTAVTLRITVDPDDMGKVIGRQGRIVRAIRTLARAAAVKAGQWVEVEIGP